MADDVSRRPKIGFRRDMRVEVLPPDLVLLLSEVETHALTGALYTKLAPLLNGRYTAEHLITDAINLTGSPPAAVSYALSRLGDYLVDYSESSDFAAYFDLLGGHVPTGSVAIHGMYPESVSVCADLLIASGIPVVEPDQSGSPHIDLHIVFVDDFLNAHLPAFNTARIADGVPWLLVKPIGVTLWHTLFVPGSGACWQCLAQRLRANRRIEQYIEHVKLGTESSTESGLRGHASIPPIMAQAAAIAAAQAVRFLSTGKSPLVDSISVTNTLTLTTESHAIVKRPQCAACGDSSSPQPQPITLRSYAGKSFRVMDAAETFERYKHHISPITGAVSLLERVQGMGSLVVYAAGDNKSRPAREWTHMRRSLRSMNAGKGTDDLSAKVSGLCEALERYSGMFQGDEPRIRATFREMADQAIHPANVLQFSERQYDTRDEWNATCPPHLYVPRRFDDDQVIDWSPLWSLTESRFVYLPTAFCYYDVPDDDADSPLDFCIPDSNGNAAGTSLEDAILQGFLEVVERDSIALWWYNRVQRPAYDLTSIDHPYIETVCREFAALNRDLWVLDITSDLGIPVMVAVSRRTDTLEERIVMGFGAHLDPEAAVIRALTEVSQMIPATLYGSDSAWENDWWRTATVRNEPYLAPRLEYSHQTVIGQRYATSLQSDIRDNVLTCVEIARRAGMDVLVLDQTRPDIGLPVVKVVVPGMAHFWGRFGCRRLTDVPVALRWQDTPTPEKEFNPRPMFL